jgi:hypothetical protein
MRPAAGGPISLGTVLEGQVRMKSILAILCGLLVTSSVGIGVPLSLEVPDGGGKDLIVVSGYVTKIDLKKQELTVHGAEATPATLPQKFTPVSGLQAPGGGRGGGRGGGAGRGNRPEEAARDFSVNVGPDTMIQTEKSTMTLNDLRIQDYVLVLGTSKGKSINATSISVSLR